MSNCFVAFKYLYEASKLPKPFNIGYILLLDSLDNNEPYKQLYDIFLPHLSVD